MSGSFTLYLVDTIATKVFAQSLSNFTCELWMMRGGTLLSPRISVGGDIVTRPFVGSWVNDCMRGWVCPSHFTLWAR